MLHRASQATLDPGGPVCEGGGGGVTQTKSFPVTTHQLLSCNVWETWLLIQGNQ